MESSVVWCYIASLEQLQQVLQDFANRIPSGRRRPLSDFGMSSSDARLARLLFDGWLRCLSSSPRPT